MIEASDQQLPGRNFAYPGPTPGQFRAEVFSAIISGASRASSSAKPPISSRVELIWAGWSQPPWMPR